MSVVSGTDADTAVEPGPPRPGTEPPGTGTPVLPPLWVIGLVGAVLLVAVGLRFYTRSDLWSDEALSVNIAALPLHDLRHLLSEDGHPPLYYFLLHVWIRLFGEGDVAVRALSGVFAVVTLPLAWFAGHRLDARRAHLGTGPPGSTAIAWTAVLVVAASPFAIQYATEARMYALLLLLGFAGYLALLRVLERPSMARAGVLTLATAALLYTHYWSFALVGVTGIALVIASVRGDHRRSARYALGGLVAGCLTFAPWFPTFLYQFRHTGTPWAQAIGLVQSIKNLSHDLAPGVGFFAWVLLGLAALGLVARAVGKRYLSVDLATYRGVRVEVAVAALAAAIGIVVSRLDHIAIEGRYLAAEFPLFLLLVAFGIQVFGSKRVSTGLLAVVVVVGLAGGFRNARENRTQAAQSANVIARQIQPGDVVAYCPDTIGPDVSRLLPSGLAQISYPPGPGPERIDWRDYLARIRRNPPVAFALRTLALAGPGHSIWFVYQKPQTAGLRRDCSDIAALFALARPDHATLVEPDSDIFEEQGLTRFLPR